MPEIPRIPPNTKLLGKKILSRKEARILVMEELSIKERYYYEHVHHLIKAKVKPLFVTRKNGVLKASSLGIYEEDVHQIICDIKEEFLRRTQNG